MAEHFVQMQMRLSIAEKELFDRRSTKEGVSVAEYLRTCAVLDSVLAGDIGAMKILGERLRAKLVERIREWQAQGVL